MSLRLRTPATARRLADEEEYRKRTRGERLCALLPVRKSLGTLEASLRRLHYSQGGKVTELPVTSERKSTTDRTVSLLHSQLSPLSTTAAGGKRFKLQLSRAKLSVNPFDLPTDFPSECRTSKSLTASSTRRFQPNRVSTKFADRFQLNFQRSLDHLAQQISTDRLNVDSALTELHEFVGPKETSIKLRHVREAVHAFRSEKLAFVYGVEFRGRYISSSHGDILKS